MPCCVWTKNELVGNPTPTSCRILPYRSASAAQIPPNLIVLIQYNSPSSPGLANQTSRSRSSLNRLVRKQYSSRMKVSSGGLKTPSVGQRLESRQLKRSV